MWSTCLIAYKEVCCSFEINIVIVVVVMCVLWCVCCCVCLDEFIVVLCEICELLLLVVVICVVVVVIVINCVDGFYNRYIFYHIT